MNTILQATLKREMDNIRPRPGPKTYFIDWFPCGNCGEWVHTSKIVKSKGRKLCPYCHMPLRMSGRSKSARKRRSERVAVTRKSKHQCQ